VPSVLGVSAVMTPPADELVAVTGDAQVMRNGALATMAGETTTPTLAAALEPVTPADVFAAAAAVPPIPPIPPAEPAVAVPDVLGALAAVPAPLLAAAVEPELAVSPAPPPPPPHAANASTTE
jgi:hypothetical protein